MKLFVVFILSICIFNFAFAQTTIKEKVKALEGKLTKQYEEKDFKRAIFTVEEILTIAPYHPRHLENGFALAYEKKDTALMMRYCKLIFSSQPENVTYGNYLLWFTLLKGQFNEAETLGKKLYFLDRGNSSVIMNYAHAVYAAKKFEEANKLYTESLLLVLSKEDLQKGLLEDFRIFHERFPKLQFDLLASKVEIEANKLLLKYKQGNDLQIEITNYIKTITDKVDYNYLTSIHNKIIAFETSKIPVRYHFVSKSYGVLAKYAYNNGSFSQCIKQYLNASRYDEIAKDDNKLITRYNNLGLIYRKLTYYDSANIYFNKTYSIAQNANDDWEIARSLENFASLSHDLNKDEQAKLYYLKASSYYERIRNHESRSNILYKLGNVTANVDSAISYSLKSLEIAELYEINSNLYAIYNNLGSSYSSKKNYKLSLEYCLKSLEFGGETLKGNFISYSRVLENIGHSYSFLNNYDSAIYYLTQSNELIKLMRSKLTEKAKVEFYSNNLTTPQLLANCYLKKNKPDQAFEFVEQTKSMLFSEKLGFNLNNKIKIDSIQKQMNDNQVYLVFSNMNSNLLLGSKSYIAFTKNEIMGNLILDSSFIIAASKYKYGSYLDTIIQRLMRFRRTGEKNGLIGKELRIFTIYYQIALANAATQKRSTVKKDPEKEDESLKKIANPLSQLLYRQFVQPIEKLLKNKKELIILADGNLSFLPFESLLNNENKYLGELYTISYLPSLKVSSILANRSTNNSDKVLALGNPIYEELTAANKQISTARKLYNSQNGFNWSSLPGTNVEVKSIANDFKSSTTLLANQATEDEVKSLSKQNKLKDFSIIHFATHGYVTTESPELSTLVLNQQNNSASEDGYLTAEEIEKLNLKANLICLSACQTGQGALKDGEGVMGLSNSFLLAGAKSTIVSMWSVSDDATSKFMSTMYQIVAKQKVSFKSALFLTRQKFINGDFGDEYKKPFYWSPFVYFGN